jgi:hypothetical protein
MSCALSSRFWTSCQRVGECSRFNRHVLKGDLLLDRIRQGAAADGDLVNELLTELNSGYPAGRLRVLLRSRDSDEVQAGVWLASELVTGGRVLYDDVVRLLSHRNFKVRYFAIDFILLNAEPADASSIRSALSLLDDPVPAVRQAAMNLASRLPEAVVRAVRAREDLSSDWFGHGIELLVDAVEKRDADVIRAALGSEDRMRRGFAAAAAARFAGQNPTCLREAASSEDAEVAKFAARRLPRSDD